MPNQKITTRPYRHASDFERVSEFLVRTYTDTAPHVNWLQPRWEYMHYHPLIHNIDLNLIRIWEAHGEIVGVVHPEHDMGIAYLEIDPEYASLRSDMLAHAETHLTTRTDDRKTLTFFVNDRDDEFQNLLAQQGYRKLPQDTCFDAMSHFPIPDPFPPIALPDGFRLQSLADNNDLPKLNRLIHRGFNHGDEPPDDGMADREFMQSAPNYKKDLNIVVVTTNGDFVSYAGIWYEPVHRTAYVEPVCTDPDYRRQGLASAAVLEAIRRCGRYGAHIAYVGAIKPVYLAIGFTQIYNLSAWRRTW